MARGDLDMEAELEGTLRPVVGRGLSREEILAAAAEEFAARGYQGTNLRHVSQRLGVTRQALYHYYERKHDILHAIFVTFFDQVEEEVDSAYRLEADPSRRFRAMLRAHFATIARAPLTSKIFILEEASLPKAERDEIMVRRRRHQARLVDAYREGVHAGVFLDVDPSLAVSVLLGAGNWMHRWVRPGGRLSPSQLADFADDLLSSGYVGRLKASAH